MGYTFKSNRAFIFALVVCIGVLCAGFGFLVKSQRKASINGLRSSISNDPTTEPTSDTTAPTIAQYSLIYSEASRVDVVVLAPIAATQGKVTALYGVSSAVTFTVTPTGLPTGITFNTKTGAFAGTPTTVTDGDASYQVTALHAGIEISAAVVINVHPAVQYTATNLVFMEGNPIATMPIVKPLPSVVSYSASVLPSGLVVDAKTGALSGSPLLQKDVTVYEVQGFDANKMLRCSAFIAIKVVPTTTMAWRGLDCGLPTGTTPTSYFMNDAKYLANAAATTISLSKQAMQSSNNRLPPPVMQSVRLGENLIYQLPCETAGFWKVQVHFVTASDIRSENFVSGTIEGLDFDYDVLVQGDNQINTDIVMRTEILVMDGVMNIVLKSASALPLSISAIEWGPRGIAEVSPSTAGEIAFGGLNNVLAQSISLSAKAPNPTGIALPQINQVSAFCVQGCTTPSNWALDGWFPSATAINKAPANAKYVVATIGAAAPLTFNLKYTPGPTSAVYPAKEVVTFRFSGVNMAPVTIDVSYQDYPVASTSTLAAPGTAILQLVTMGPAVPLAFNAVFATNLLMPTQLEVGPDNRLYVGTNDAKVPLNSFVYSYAIDENYNLSDQQIVAKGINGVFGLAFNPFNGDKVIIYVSTGIQTEGAGGCYAPGSTMSYSSIIYTFTKLPNGLFQEDILVRNVPISNHDHGANGIIFDQNGDMLISIASSTNAGVPGTCKVGQIPDSYLQAAIVRIPISKSTLPRTLQYFNSDGTLNMNQWQGYDTPSMQQIPVHMGPTDISIYSPGHRNAFDCVFTKAGYIFCNDNGPNIGFGPFSTGPGLADMVLEFTEKDELNKIYPYAATKTVYGMANRNRAAVDNDPIQNIFHGPADASQGTYKAPIAQLDSASGGLSVYNSRCFNGALEGAMLAQGYKHYTVALTLTADGEAEVNRQKLQFTVPPNLQNAEGLDVYHSRGGALLISSYTKSTITAYVPFDAAATAGAFVVYDIFPWRTPAAGGNSFVISGDNFGVSAKVYFGGVAGTVTSVTQKRIYGVFPAGKASPTLLDMEVDMWFPDNTARKIVYPQAMRYIPLPGNEPNAVY